MVDGPDDDHGDGGAHLPDLPRALLAPPLLLLLLRLLQRLKVLQVLHVRARRVQSTLQFVGLTCSLENTVPM